jgi:hypothetical protein
VSLKGYSTYFANVKPREFKPQSAKGKKEKKKKITE